MNRKSFSRVNPLKKSYLSSLHLFFVQGVVLLILILLYRYRVFHLIKSIYPEIKNLSFISYLFLSMHYDGLALLLMLTLLISVLMITSGKKMLHYCLSTALIIVILMFLLSTIEFFRIYETTFQTSFVGREHFSSLVDILKSGIFEFSIYFFIYFISLSFFITAMIVIIYRWDFNLSIFDEESPSRLVQLIKFFPPGTAILLIIIVLTGISSSKYDSYAEHYNRKNSSKFVSTLHELSMNPFYNLFFPEIFHKEPVHLSSKVPGTAKAFSFKFNTDSMESGEIYKRSTLIPRGEKYNIVLYFFESTPVKYLNIKINGKHVVPTLLKMMENSFYSENHYANYPLSANAMLSVFTSAYDMNSKAMVIQKYPDIDLQTISEILKDKGYRTCLIHTGELGYAGQRRFLKNRKFDKIIDYMDLVRRPPYNRKVGWGVDERAMIKPAVEFIEEDREKPYCIIFLPVNPHHPYAIPDKSFRISGKIPDNIDYKKKNWLRYLNSLHFSDAALGNLVDTLENQELLDNTLFFLFADHGEAFYQHRQNYNHPLFLYEENVHVPFLIYNRKIFREPARFSGITRHIDILPTILDLLGIESSVLQEGVSIFSSHREQLAIIHTSWKNDLMAVRDGKWKYIIRTRDKSEELYDLEKDPDEKGNIAGANKNITERYRQLVYDAITYKKEYYKKVLGK